MYKGGRWERGQVTPLWVTSRPEQGVCERNEERPDHRGLGSRMIEGHGVTSEEVHPGGRRACSELEGLRQGAFGHPALSRTGGLAGHLAPLG